MDTYTSLKIQCAEAGTSITEVCRRAGIQHQVIHAWKNNEPKSIKTLKRLEALINEIKAENAAQRLPANRG
jgi:transposase-like protein